MPTPGLFASQQVFRDSPPEPAPGNPPPLPPAENPLGRRGGPPRYGESESESPYMPNVVSASISPYDTQEIVNNGGSGMKVCSSDTNMLSKPTEERIYSQPSPPSGKGATEPYNPYCPSPGSTTGPMVPPVANCVAPQLIQSAAAPPPARKPPRAFAFATSLSSSSRLHFQKTCGHRCSWKVATFVLIVLAVVLTAFMAYLAAMSSLSVPPESGKACVVVEAESQESNALATTQEPPTRGSTASRPLPSGKGATEPYNPYCPSPGSTTGPMVPPVANCVAPQLIQSAAAPPPARKPPRAFAFATSLSSSSRLHFQKTCGHRCSWKVATFVLIVLAVVLTAFMAYLAGKHFKAQYNVEGHHAPAALEGQGEGWRDAGGAVGAPGEKRAKARVRGEEFVKNVKEKIDGNPGKSMRAIAKEMDVGSMTIVRTIHEDLGLKSYAFRKGQLLTENMKNNRKGKAAALLNNLKHDSFGMLRFFSDEKNFDVDQKINPRNDRWICKDPSEIPVVMHTKFPASVMVLGVISSEGDVMPPHFFEKGLRMNADTYINVLETVVKPWMDMVAAGRKYVFQQDSAPAHKAKKTQSWLTLNVPSHWGPDIWPPNSPDCNPLDYYVWGVVERDVNKAPHTTIQSVKKAVHTVMTQMDKVIIAKACASFRTRLETVVANNGNYIE
ncbi:hypothetical protein LAZ67_13000780 [Cordylochernes scorpioides]|uniref:Tc1-like transposase DDE domain-containing protein n=1 Tax=Cordylochernes scorpioides TaxID=51811 RepID=A0ABY6L556_9ARAC|nr:hypothetical protein LAZ67_13000780 [Cordylochernes scorpioides]